jgi:5S rRNA maturation endonuclease (ribonuclease M5)
MRSAEEIKASVSIVDVAKGYGITGKQTGQQVKVCCPFHQDKTPSCVLYVNDNGWKCFGCDAHGDVIDFVQRMEGCDFAQAVEKLGGTSAKARNEPSEKWSCVASYQYYSRTGEIAYVVERLESGGKKRFIQKRCDNGRLVNGMDGVERVLYRLPQVRKSQEVVLCEGEKCVHALERCGYVAACNSGGSSAWLDAYADDLKGKHVTVMPDSDQPGQKWCEAVCKSLEGKVADLRVVKMPEKYNDIADMVDDIGESSATDWLLSEWERIMPIERGVRLEIYSASEMMRMYKESVTRAQSRKIDFGLWLPSLGANVRPLVPGDLCTVIADTGVGKTAIAQNLALSQRPRTVLFFEIELDATQMAERYTANTNSIDCYRVEDAVKHGVAYDTSAWSHIYTCTLSHITVEAIENMVRRSSLKTGSHPDLVCIDYIGLISGPESKRYERMSRVAEGLKVLAKACDTVVLVTSQVHRGEDSDKVGLHSAKDSGSIENSSQLVLGAWRPEKDRMVIKVLKQTKGMTGYETNAHYVGAQMRIEEDSSEWL